MTNVDIAEGRKVISEHPFWKGLKAEYVDVLAEQAMLTQFRPGEVIFRTGDPANRFYCLLDGEVELWSIGKEGSRVKIESLHAGEALGWSWLFPPYAWAFDAVAKERTRAIFFYGTPLREYCNEDSGFGFELMRRMSEVVVGRLQATRAKLALCLRTEEVVLNTVANKEKKKGF